MKKKLNLKQNPFLLFAPFLLIFIIYALLNPSKGDGDEGRYLMFAKNLIHGFYSPPAPNINLTNGPGYPLVLVPFVALELPLVCITVLNAFFYYFSIIYLYKALNKTVSQKVTYFFSFFWACYYLAYQNIPYVMTETFTYFLISLFVFYTVEAFKTEVLLKKKIIIAGFVMGYIVLTKIAFIYVLLVMLVGLFLITIFARKMAFKKCLLIVFVGFLTILPYLIYTYHLTGRMFYWNTNTGATLYWSSTPYKDEYGDWKQDLEQGSMEWGNYNIPGSRDTLVAHHKKDYELVFGKTEFSQFGMKQDDAFKRLAIKNIESHPLKYLQNCFYNAGRLIFHYPFSEAIQRPKVLYVFPINGIVFSLMILSSVLTIINWKKLDFHLKFLITFAFLYLGLSTLVTAYVRMFTIIVPVLFFWFAYIINKSVIIRKKFDE